MQGTRSALHHRRRSRGHSYSSASPGSDYRGDGHRGKRADHSDIGRRDRDSRARYEDAEPSRHHHHSSRGHGTHHRPHGSHHRSDSPGTPPPTRSGVSSGFPVSSRGDSVQVRKEGGTLSTPNVPNSVTSKRRKSRLPTSLILNRESVLRRNRRERAMEREEDAQRRESCGKKPYLIHVNSEGQAYGLGVSVWNDALSKVVRGLDPSYIDIRQQPCHLMDTLLKRLDEEFDYSDTVNSSWLRKRIGNALSSYRHELMKMIQAKETRPPWVSESVWEKLVKMSESEKYKRKSEAKRYANSCRRSYGRTGPIGEVGIIERLRKILGRSPAQDEIQVEMHAARQRIRRPQQKATPT